MQAFEDLELEVDGAVMRAGREMLAEEHKRNEREFSGGEGGTCLVGPDSQGRPSKEEGEDAGPGPGTAGVLGSAARVSPGDGAGMMLPIAPHRRLRQAVLLAQKLLRKEGELEAARRGLEEVEGR